MKDEKIIIRIQKSKKDSWKKLSLQRNISLSSLIISSVENRIFNDERRTILLFIEKQDNFFVKIETNINQIAKIANAQKLIKKDDLENFNELLQVIIDLKSQQNEVFLKIYSLLAHDH